MSAACQVQTKTDQVWRRVHAACSHPPHWLLLGSVRGLFTTDAPTASVVRLITLLAALAAFAIAAALPTAWFFAARAGLRGEVEIRAQLYAAQIGEAARQDPVLWNALAGDAMAPTPTGIEVRDATGVAERQRIYSIAGRMLVDSAVAIPSWPFVVARRALTDGATQLGEAEVARSLRPALETTAVVAGAAGCLGLLMFLLLRIAPLRLLKAAVEHASFLSAHDLLTGLPNRRLFQALLEQALERAQRDRTLVGVFYLDLDHFKQINDLLGHPAGDATLRMFAERLRKRLRASDTLARLGGDEFAVIQPMLRRSEDADALGRVLLETVVQPFEFDGQLLYVGLSIGISLSEAGACGDPDQLMRQADMALYQAKDEGRGRARFFAPEMNEKLHERRAMETDLRCAVTGSGLVLHYQPQIDLATGHVVGAEALIRWHRPGHGTVQPDRFISLAEDTGLIVPIGLWVLREACHRATRWPAHIGIAVNVSPVQLRQPDFVETMTGAICESGIAPSRVELEITESVLMQDTEQTLAKLAKLHTFGVALAMDDFGTGYSSLGYLQKFRFDKIKIDRSFISRLGQDRNADAIVRAVVGMTAALGVRANAEGVETNEQAEVLREQGCSEAQGFLYSRPISGEAFESMLQDDLAATDTFASGPHDHTALKAAERAGGVRHADGMLRRPRMPFRSFWTGGLQA
jgi:diguanylate cyclase (GGDEF)-like protein